MRYDPLKKNVVRPFRYICIPRRCTQITTVCCRALFSFMFGLVRGVVHSALTLGVTPLRHFLSMKKTKSVAIDSKSKSLPVCDSEQVSCLSASFVCMVQKKALRLTPSPLKRTLTSRPAPVLESHPLRCFKRSASEMPKGVITRHRRNHSDAVDSSSRDIAEVSEKNGDEIMVEWRW